MKKNRLILPLMLSVIGLAACAPQANINSESSSEEPSVTLPSTSEDKELVPGVHQSDLDFRGISIGNKKYASSDYDFGGVLEDLYVESWLVAGIDYQFTVEAKQGATPKFDVIFDDDSVVEHKLDIMNAKATHKLIGKKTGATVMYIFVGEEMIFRQAVNVRVPVRDAKVTFDHLANADYWYGVGTKMMNVGDYRMMFSEGKDGLNTKASLSMKEKDEDYGTVVFQVNVETAQEVSFLSFHSIRYEVSILQATKITPIFIDVSLSLDTIYVVDREQTTDFFRPVYL